MALAGRFCLVGMRHCPKSIGFAVPRDRLVRTPATGSPPLKLEEIEATASSGADVLSCLIASYLLMIAFVFLSVFLMSGMIWELKMRASLLDGRWQVMTNIARLQNSGHDIEEVLRAAYWECGVPLSLWMEEEEIQETDRNGFWDFSEDLVNEFKDYQIRWGLGTAWRFTHRIRAEDAPRVI